MKILTWNLERPKKNQLAKINLIHDMVKHESADIIIVTETNRCIDFGNEYFALHTDSLPSFYDNQNYFEGENRVSIYSKFPFRNQISTYNSFTTVCGSVETDFGELVIYGSIIGSFGGKGFHFENDLEKQKKDIENLKGNICFSGDFNISFSGWKYPSIKVIEETKEFFSTQNLEIITEKNKDSAIHTVINKEFLKDKIYTTNMIDTDRKLSDHNLIVCEISKKIQPL
ncbi:endonuclease/exonuclease/phosphatase family protein [Chryseobacterium caseinilyticum]|uniref:Endonuclease/exonuclease/phosphatase family protein n=1 Tax=Chryseobacterium caseinilyticum TaxID=2771428 RepID=A0ABR8Z7C0_9FLAO|nr:endonuclease/exonuclease/phosphatase family protein [Chryseobacterium caseinilyticum]MBD8081200.1 endonuclease/exonuclease/phosphatase family protein [Chryseobacterium caseinilyticum]